MMILDKKQSLQLLKEMKRNENRKLTKKEKDLIKWLLIYIGCGGVLFSFILL